MKSAGTRRQSHRCDDQNQGGTHPSERVILRRSCRGRSVAVDAPKARDHERTVALGLRDGDGAPPAGARERTGRYGIGHLVELAAWYRALTFSPHGVASQWRWARPGVTEADPISTGPSVDVCVEDGSPRRPVRVDGHLSVLRSVHPATRLPGEPLDERHENAFESSGVAVAKCHGLRIGRVGRRVVRVGVDDERVRHDDRAPRPLLHQADRVELTVPIC